MMEDLFIGFGVLNKDTINYKWSKKCIYINGQIYLLGYLRASRFSMYLILGFWIGSPMDFFSALRCWWSNLF